MFRHIIFFRFKSQTSIAEIDSMFEKIGALKEIIPGILTYSWGANAWQSGGGIDTPYTYAFVMDFDTKASRDSYQVHEAHVALVQQFVMPYIESATVFDYLCAHDVLK